MQSTITYRFDPDDETSIEALRLTTRTIKIKDVGAHARMSQEAINQWRHECGLDPEPVEGNGSTPSAGSGTHSPTVPTPEKNPTQEQMVTYNAYTRWAKCACATGKVQVVKRTKKGKELDEDAPDTWPWEDSSLAALGLDKPEGAMDLKTDLLEAWERAVDGVNPGVFGRPLTSQAKKKTGVLSVT